MRVRSGPCRVRVVEFSYYCTRSTNGQCTNFTCCGPSRVVNIAVVVNLGSPGCTALGCATPDLLGLGYYQFFFRIPLKMESLYVTQSLAMRYTCLLLYKFWTDWSQMRHVHVAVRICSCIQSWLHLVLCRLLCQLYIWCRKSAPTQHTRRSYGHSSTTHVLRIDDAVITKPFVVRCWFGRQSEIGLCMIFAFQRL